MLDQPILPAGPCVLRPFTMEDLELVREASADPYIPAVTTVPTPFSTAAGRAFVERQWSRAETGQGWSWAIARIDDDRERSPRG